MQEKVSCSIHRVEKLLHVTYKRVSLTMKFIIFICMCPFTVALAAESDGQKSNVSIWTKVKCKHERAHHATTKEYYIRKCC